MDGPADPGSRRARVSLVAALCALPACTSTSDSTLQVFAASSLTEAFEVISERYRASHPGMRVAVTYAGSQVLRYQIERGAPADVFASANAEHVEGLVRKGLMIDSQAFASNEVGIALPRPDPLELTGFEDLGRARRIVVGTEAVPVGRYTNEVFARAEAIYGQAFVDTIRSRVVSEESNVRLVRAKVELGEADAAFVYRTDAQLSSRAAFLPLPDALRVRVRYPAAWNPRSPRAEQARIFHAWLRSVDGQSVLKAHGFLTETQ